MITMQGQLSIRTITGRNGDFNVGRLVTSIGEFVVKDVDLDQYDEGKYDGDFVVSQISPSYYSTNGRLVVEQRALLSGMTLSRADKLQPDDVSKIAMQEIDPVDEEPFAKPDKTVSKTAAFMKNEAPFGVDDASKPKESQSQKSQTKKSFTSNGNETESDEEIFGILMPLGNVVKLDSTVNRLVFRKQCARLGALGYTFESDTQDWHLKSF